VCFLVTINEHENEKVLLTTDCINLAHFLTQFSLLCIWYSGNIFWSLL